MNMFLDAGVAMHMIYKHKRYIPVITTCHNHTDTFQNKTINPCTECYYIKFDTAGDQSSSPNQL
jgi:hypothetical protein